MSSIYSQDNEEQRQIRKNKPEDTDFRQQRIRSWQLIFTPRHMIQIFFGLGIQFVTIGLQLFVSNSQVVYMEIDYTNKTCETNQCNTLQIDFKIKKNMTQPIFVYYKQTNFYQNHHNYLKSRSNKQLSGSPYDITSCDPQIEYNGKILYPCGQVANSVFNDTFTGCVIDVNNTTCNDLGNNWSTKDIAWTSDKERFKDLFITKTLPNNLTRIGPQGKLPYINDEHFIVWMRAAGLPTFHKLYAKITTDLKAGQILRINADYNYKVTSYNGKKFVAISTTTWLGGENDILVYSYQGVGISCVIISIIFAIFYFYYPRSLGEMYPTKHLKHN